MNGKKLLSMLALCLFCFGVTGCGASDADGTDSQTPSSAASSVPVESTPSDLSNSAMLGNSYLYGFDTYAVLPETDCFYRVGLNVRTVFTEPMLNHDIPVIEELNNGRTYDRVFLMFGENELGWPNEQAFLDGYGQIIDTVREYQPEATIYVQSMLPVSAEVSAKNENGINNEQIRSRNEKLKELAEQKDAVYLDFASEIQDENGDLPADAATDGIHPGISYYKIWAEFLQNHTEEKE